MTIKAAIVGYGNLGQAVEHLINAFDDFELFGIFSRRDTLDTDAAIYPVADAARYKDEIDVLFLCVGSATDIPEQAAGFAEHFTTVDTYDNHSKVATHYAEMDEVARANDNVSVISTGWDPGLFSMNRVLGLSLFPDPVQNTFWGKGLSQGHSDAVRQVSGVQRGVQYTIPAQSAIDQARAGNGQGLSKTASHERIVYIVADESEQDRIRDEIVTMPDYFEPYDTTVHFVSDEEFERNHQGAPHGGYVITTSELQGHNASVEFSLKLESNPNFTAAAMVAFGRAAARLQQQGNSGAYTVLEVPPYLLSQQSHQEMMETGLV
ncbi:diaminopimelate dehydrogenase [Yaniella flava]|uniref:Meso-diaminopimelate D-dehydrogenase n=1 Tax=Yaniella flava TaxID=287930 RepID=A0ABN2ULN7_9MICC